MREALEMFRHSFEVGSKANPRDSFSLGAVAASDLDYQAALAVEDGEIIVDAPAGVWNAAEWREGYVWFAAMITLFTEWEWRDCGR